MKEKCSAQTKKGYDCKKPRMEGSRFCFMHQYIDNFGKFKVPFWQNSTVHLIIAVLAFGYAVVFWGIKRKPNENDKEIKYPSTSCYC